MNPIESMMAPLFDEVSDGICAADAEGKIIYMNPAAERMLEISLSRARGRSECELLCGLLATATAKECASTCALRDPLCPDKAVTFKGRHNQRKVYKWNELEFKRVEKWRDMKVRCLRMPTSSEGGGSRFTIIEDTSAELELERRREDWRNMVAHDLRNPLSAIFAAARELQDETPQSELLKICVRNCRRMTALLDRYLDVAKLESGRMPVKLARLPLAAILAACVEDQAPLAREKRVEIKIEAPASLAVLADADLLPRVILNLLDNAVKFSPEASQVVIKAAPEGNDAVRLSFQDAGPGIDPEDLPNLFDRYHQSASGAQSKIKGTGLGLAFCREALKVMNATITVESQPGAGSVFSIRLPRRAP